jgi:hypothetical protein
MVSLKNAELMPRMHCSINLPAGGSENNGRMQIQSPGEVCWRASGYTGETKSHFSVVEKQYVTETSEELPAI